jgi:hypothetical protein
MRKNVLSKGSRYMINKLTHVYMVNKIPVIKPDYYNVHNRQRIGFVLNS